MRLKNKILSTFRHQTLQVHPGIFRPASKPYITGDTFRKNADHIFDETQTLLYCLCDLMEKESERENCLYITPLPRVHGKKMRFMQQTKDRRTRKKHCQ